MSTLKGKQGDLMQVRRWARQNGFTVADRGAIPSDAMEAYKRKLRDWAVTHKLAGRVGRISAETIEQFNAQNIATESANGNHKKANSTKSTPVAVRRPKASEIRKWARAHGHKVSDRGRLSTKVLRDFVSS